MTNLDDDLKNKIEELGGLRAALQAAKDDLTEEKNKIHQYVAEKKAVEVQTATLRNSLQELQVTYRGQVNSNKEDQTKIQTLEKDKSALTETQDQLQRLQIKHAELVNSTKNNQDKVQALEKDKSILMGVTEQLRKQVAKHEAEVDVLQTKHGQNIKELNQSIDDTKNKWNEQQKNQAEHIANMEAGIQVITNEHEGLKVKIRDLGKKCLMLEIRNRYLSKENSRKQTSVNGYRRLYQARMARIIYHGRDEKRIY